MYYNQHIKKSVSFSGSLWLRKSGFLFSSLQFLFGDLKENQFPGGILFSRQKVQGTPSLCFYV